MTSMRTPPRPVRSAGVVLLVLALATACGGRAQRPVDGDAAGAESGSAGAEEVASEAAPSPSPTASPSPTESPAPDPTPTQDAESEQSHEVLSPCSPSTEAETRTVVDATGPRPSEATIEAALEEFPDLQHLVRSLESEGVATADARHEAYAQVVADDLFAELQQLPGYVSGAVAKPTRGVPFSVEFSGELPDGFDPSRHELESYGLEVTTGAAGFDEALLRDAVEAAEAAGLVVADVVDDPVAGTVDVEVVQATPEQVATFEAELDEPDRVCLLRVPPDVPCDDAVVAEAEAAAERQGEVIDGVPISDAEAEEIRRSHLGLSEEASADKAAEEQRGWRVVSRDGVSFPVTADAQPGRLGVTICHGVVVDATVEWWEE